MSRGPNRLRALVGAMANALGARPFSARPRDPKRILVLHELLLGDTLMLTPLLAALRHLHPGAEILVTAHPAHAVLFSGRPYGVRVLPFSEREPNALAALSPARECELAILPGENRLAMVARALGAGWIVGFAQGKPAWRDRALDELVGFPGHPTALGDLFALLSGIDPAGAAGLRFKKEEWPAPDYSPYDHPAGPYAVLHVGAGSPLRLWPAERWRDLARTLSASGLNVVWTSGSLETGLIEEIDPDGMYLSLGGRLDLAQLWHLLAGAQLAVTLDTGIAHLAKLTGTRTAALYGPGSALLFGKGRFWEANPFVEVTIPDFPCRDQRHLFKREIEWVRRCNRTLEQCPRARCMEGIEPERVAASLQVQ